MIQHALVQGSEAWHAHRTQYLNASDAPAMMGVSPYETRTQLIHRLVTGIAPEVDAATQRRFDDGHRFEALARPLAVEIVGEALYPVVGSEGRYSASFDGLTMAEDIAFEHKSLNDDLRACMRQQGGNANDFLPLLYRIQMEQQLMVSGAEKVLFMASKWDGETLIEQRHCWYTSDAKLRADIVAGWEQLQKDRESYVPSSTAPAIVAEPVQALPAVTVQVTGEITIKDNFASFETALRDFLEHRLIREPKTDQDFADLDVQIKAMKGAEAALDSAEAGWIAQIEAVSTAKGRKDMLQKLVKDNRLMAEKLLASEKERRKAEIVTKPATELRAYMATLNRELGAPYIPMPVVDFAGAIKGMRSLASMEDAVATRLAQAKIDANAIAATVRANLKTLDELGADHSFLFADKAQIVLKASDDLQALVQYRVADHKAKEEKRLEAERERIRAEEVARLEREQAQEAERNRITTERESQQVLKAEAATPDATDRVTPAIASPGVGPMGAGQPADAGPIGNVVPMRTPAPVADTGARIKLGDINAAIAPLSINADGLAALGFTHVAMDKAAKLYRLIDLPKIYAAIVQHLEAVQAKQAA